SSAIHAEKADTLIQVTLAGAKSADPATRPTGLEMPPFAWKLSDSEVADVITYLRNAWGNQASPVSADEVSTVRQDVLEQGAPHVGALASPYEETAVPRQCHAADLRAIRCSHHQAGAAGAIAPDLVGGC